MAVGASGPQSPTSLFSPAICRTNHMGPESLCVAGRPENSNSWLATENQEARPGSGWGRHRARSMHGEVEDEVSGDRSSHGPVHGGRDGAEGREGGDPPEDVSP